MEPDTESLKPSYRGIEALGFVLLIAFMALVAISCDRQGKSSGNKAAFNENVLRFDVGAPFGSLKPTDGELLGSTLITPLLYSYLFVPNQAGRLEPDLAVKWSYDPTHYTWTIELRKDAYFHDKQQVTAKDVAYTFARYVGQYTFGFLSLIDRIEVASETTVEIVLKRDDPEYPYKIWDLEIIARPRENSENTDTADHPVGSGPFKFQYRNGEKEVGLVANNSYFNGRPSLDRLIFYFVPDREKSWARLLSGKTDIVQSIYPRDYEMIKQYQDSFYFNLTIVNHYTLLLFNTIDPLFTDPNVRMALSLAVDKEYLVRKILGGAGVVAAGPMGIVSPYHNPEVKPVPFSPKKGLELLEKAGWSYGEDGRYLQKDGKPFDFTIFVLEGYQVHRKIAEYLQLCFNDIGIKAHLQVLPFDVFVKKYQGNRAFQAVLTEFAGARGSPENLQNMWTPGPGSDSGAGCFEHPGVSALFPRAIQEKNPSFRKELFYQIDDLLNSLQPAIFLFHRKSLDAMSKRIKLPFAFSIENAGIYRLRHASIEAQ